MLRSNQSSYYGLWETIGKSFSTLLTGEPQILMSNYNILDLRKVPLAFVFKIVAIGIGAFWLPIFLCIGLFALFGADTIRLFDHDYLHGVSGLIAVMLLYLLWIALATVSCGSMIFVGLRIYGLFWSISLQVPHDSPDKLGPL